MQRQGCEVRRGVDAMAKLLGVASSGHVRVKGVGGMPVSCQSSVCFTGPVPPNGGNRFPRVLPSD